MGSSWLWQDCLGVRNLSDIYIYIDSCHEALYTDGCYRIQLAANALSDGNGVVWVGRFDKYKMRLPS